jgi:hypothetical protein
VTIVTGMWWRVLGVAVVLLAAGVVGGYAVADRSTGEPASSTTLEPIPAVSPSVPTPPVYDVRPDPEADPLEPGLPSSETELRITKRGPGVSVLIPDDWLQNRLPDSQTWNFSPPINTKNTYGLRVQLMIGQRLAATVAKATRIAALQSAEEQGNIVDLEISNQTDTTFEASYIADGYLRVTMEQWVADENGTAYADLAVTGRSRDREGLRDLLARTTESVQYLDPLPPKNRG